MEYGFFNSLNGDRKYNARDISRYFEHIISSGLYKTIFDNMKVTAAGGMSLRVAPGAGLIDSQWFRQKESATVTIGTAHAVLPRIDSVVVRLDLSDAVRSIVLDVVAGTPADAPEATPPVREENIKELVLAHVYVGAAATEITNANITDTRANEDICGWAQSMVDAPLLTTISYVYTTTAGATTSIPIDIAGYNPAMDIINVYNGGLRLIPGTDYTINRDAQRIELAESVKSGTVIAIEALKPIQPDELPETAAMMQDVLNEVTAYNERITALEDDAGGVKGVPVVEATSADGIAYAATVEGVPELSNGFVLTIVPKVVSASTSVTFNFNGFGAKRIFLPMSADNAAMIAPQRADYFAAGRPITLQYDASADVWKTLGKQAGAMTYTATIPTSGWSGSAAPYSVSVTVAGILADDVPIIDLVQSGTESTDSARREAWGEITRITTAANSIKVYASAKPAVTIPIQMKVVR